MKCSEKLKSFKEICPSAGVFFSKRGLEAERYAQILHNKRHSIAHWQRFFHPTQKIIRQQPDADQNVCLQKEVFDKFYCQVLDREDGNCYQKFRNTHLHQSQKMKGRGTSYKRSWGKSTRILQNCGLVSFLVLICVRTRAEYQRAIFTSPPHCKARLGWVVTKEHDFI